MDKKCVSPRNIHAGRTPITSVPSSAPPTFHLGRMCVTALRLSSHSILFSAYELLETARSRMAAPHCPACGNKMAKIGKTGADEARWRRASCGASSIRRIDNAAELLEALLSRPLTRRRQTDMPGSGRAFRRKAARFWEIWPMPPKAERPRRVIYVDGIHLGRRAAVLIASDDDHVLGWHLAHSENSRARASPMGRIGGP